jgi:hypothetical protein
VEREGGRGRKGCRGREGEGGWLERERGRESEGVEHKRSLDKVMGREREEKRGIRGVGAPKELRESTPIQLPVVRGKTPTTKGDQRGGAPPYCALPSRLGFSV